MMIKSLVPSAFLKAREPGRSECAHTGPGKIFHGAATNNPAWMVQDMLNTRLVTDYYICSLFGKEVCSDADRERMGRGGVRIGRVEGRFEENKISGREPGKVISRFQDNAADRRRNHAGGAGVFQTRNVNRFHVIRIPYGTFGSVNGIADKT